MKVGLVHLTNTGSMTPKTLKAPFEHILGTDLQFEPGSNPRQAIEEDVFETGVSSQVK